MISSLGNDSFCSDLETALLRISLSHCSIWACYCFCNFYALSVIQFLFLQLQFCSCILRKFITSSAGCTYCTSMSSVTCILIDRHVTSGNCICYNLWGYKLFFMTRSQKNLTFQKMHVIRQTQVGAGYIKSSLPHIFSFFPLTNPYLTSSLPFGYIVLGVTM